VKALILALVLGLIVAGGTAAVMTKWPYGHGKAEALGER
jgi:hypothetical protein